MKVGCKSQRVLQLERLYARQCPHNGIKSMEYALSVLVNFFCRHVDIRHGVTSSRLTNFHLTLFYQCAAEITQDQRLQVIAINILRRTMFVLQDVHSQHYTDYIFQTNSNTYIAGDWQ